MKEVLTKKFWQDVKKTFKEAEEDTTDKSDEPSLASSSSDPKGTGPSEASIEVFACPGCKRMIGSSLTTCRFCGAAVDPRSRRRARIQARIDRALALPKFSFLPLVFWVCSVAIYDYPRWVPPGFLAFWPLAPLVLLAMIILCWPGPHVKGVEHVFPSHARALLVWRLSLWAWTLTFPVPAFVLFLVHPDALSRVGKMIGWGFTHRVLPYPY